MSPLESILHTTAKLLPFFMVLKISDGFPNNIEDFKFLNDVQGH